MMSKLRDQHKAFAEWFLQQNPIAPNVEDMAWAAWKAALAQPESEPFGWVRASDAAAFGDSGTTETATLFSVEPGSVECVPLYAHPPSEEWRLASEPPEDDRDVVVWIRQSQNHGFMEIDSFLRPEKRWRSRGVTLWRDVTPPTECER